MNKHKISRAMRFMFFSVAAILILGIWLTGFKVVSWVLYVPPASFMFAALTGICPGLISAKALFPEQE